MAYRRSDEQRKAMFAHMQSPRMRGARRTIKRKLKSVGIEAPYRDDIAQAAVAGIGATIAPIALRAIRHPLGKIVTGMGTVALIGKVGKAAGNLGTKLTQYARTRKIQRIIRSSRTRPLTESSYIQEPRFPKVRWPGKPPRVGRIIIA